MLTLLHTAKSHCARFDALRACLAPHVTLNHVVKEAWLSEAAHGITDNLAQDITNCVRAQESPLLCTCTTIGAVAEEAGAMRIDRPMMREAARLGGPVLLAYCLDSTRQPSVALLRDEIGGAAVVRPLSLAHRWPLFLAGDLTGFEAAIAADIRALRPTSGCVVLAQASMAGAAGMLADLEVPVLASPEIAFRAMLDRL